MTEPLDAASDAEYRYLNTPAAIRERASAVLAYVEAGASRHWRIDWSRLEDVTTRVIEVTRESYPHLALIPYHGRLRHFDVGGVARNRSFERRISSLGPDAQLAARVELIICSVLLDAGAGEAWRFRDANGGSYSRSEGLAVASYELFTSGALSSAPGALQADARGLSAFDGESLRRAFQISEANPLTGGEGRAELLRRLGGVVARDAEYFGMREPRLGNFGVTLARRARDGHLAASAVLGAVLDAFSEIWLGRERLAGKSLGDVWRHSELGLIPFHKLSQWLSYSLFEALEARGVVIDDIDALTGLAEYRNGGLFVDGGVLRPLRERDLDERHAVSSDFVIEWRALTVSLLDRVAQAMRQRLGLSREQLPLARVLEGGSWRAGRVIARELRADGSPPVKLISDGTVF